MTIDLRPRNDIVNGKKLEDFIKKYWQTLCPIPQQDNPAWKNNGSKDGSFNSLVNEDLYMLSFSRDPQAGVNRTIHVPNSNKGLFIPVMSVVVSACETTDDLITVANKDQASILSSPGVLLKFEGNPVNHNNYIFAPASIGTFPVEFPDKEDAIFNIPNSNSKENSCDAVAAGRYVWTQPLSSGTYKVHFEGKIQCNNITVP
jgi:hypothetical protein